MLKICQVNTQEDIDTFTKTCRRLFPVHYSAQLNHKAFLIYQESVCVGVFSFQATGTEAYIFTFGILPEYRGCGIGRESWKLVESMLLDDFTVGKITLHVNVENPKAINFYEDLGFVISQRIERYYSELKLCGAYLMTKKRGSV